MKHPPARTLVFSALTSSALLLALLGAAPARPAQPASERISSPGAQRAYRLVNGRWFDGHGFRDLTMYVADGVLTLEPPPGHAQPIDLGGGFVVPPFGEAHNHNIESAGNFEQQSRDYLRDGIFYVKIQNSIRERTDAIRNRVNHPQGLDVAFAYGGLTSSGGHPMKLYQDILRDTVYPGVDREWFLGRAYHAIDREEDLERQWAAIRSTRPDFIKVFLWYTEEFETRREDPQYFGRRGLDPRLLPLVVARARAAGLRVSAHVETAADFRRAVAAGVDEVTHLPGCNPSPSRPSADYEIAEADAERAARVGTVVVTTANLAARRAQGDRDLLQRIQEIERRNLRLLHGHGVPIAVGSDRTEWTALAEALYLHDLQVFDNATLLGMWCETTARTIFPQRRIGRLQPGYEASFLVLDGDPLEDFRRVQSIRMRFKQGQPLHVDPPASGPQAAPGGKGKP